MRRHEVGRIAVWGAAGHAKVVADAWRCRGGDVAGFLDDVAPQRRGESFFGACVLGGREALPGLRADGLTALALGFGDNAARLALGTALRAEGWRLPPIVHPAAVVAADVVLGEGCLVAAGAVINPGARIGAFAIVNTGAIVDHDGQLDDGVHLGPRACLAGGVEVGRGAWIGAGATVRDRCRIGAGTVIGLGAAVVSDIPPAVVAQGCPARVVRAVVEGQR